MKKEGLFVDVYGDQGTIAAQGHDKKKKTFPKSSKIKDIMEERN